MNGKNYEMGINYEKITTDSAMAAITKMTAAQLMKNPYMTLADFFKGLTNSDLTVLAFMIEAAQGEDPESMQNLILLSMMLAQAEGAPPLGDDDTRNNVNFFMQVVLCESLKRKGLVEITYENMSFGADMAGKPFVKVKDGVDLSDYM